MIPYDMKRKCVELAHSGKTSAEIYDEYIKGNCTMSLRSFRRRLAEWKQKAVADENTLEAANLAYKFTPHASTVQVNAKGEVITNSGGFDNGGTLSPQTMNGSQIAVILESHRMDATHTYKFDKDGKYLIEE